MACPPERAIGHQPYEEMRAPVGAGGGRRSHPRGSTGRVGAGLTRPGLPRDEARSPHVTGPQPPKRHPSH